MTIARVDALIDELRSAGDIPAGLCPLLHDVPREKFIPDRAWKGDDYEPIDRGANLDEWSQAVYSNTQIVTQFNDGAVQWPDTGKRPTCSNSMPSAVLGMFDALGAKSGDEVLEIGTGTGWTGAMLTRIVGSRGEVVSVEIDRQLAEEAQDRLDRAGFRRVRVINRDGTTGVPDLAPFDRVISTMAVQLGRIPYAWVQQTKPGGTILTPVRADLASGPLVRFTVHWDGTATGRMMPMGVGFMEHRLDRTATTPDDGIDWEDNSADTSITSTKPWPMFTNAIARWALAVALPSCRYGIEEPTEGRTDRLAWLRDPMSGSWASVIQDQPERFLVRQSGIRRLWHEAETAYLWWIGQGQPAGTDWEWSITPDSQSVRLNPEPE